jgi:hypothetical protein
MLQMVVEIWLMLLLPPLLLKARNLWKVVIHTVNLEREEKDAEREQKSLEERERVLKNVKCKNYM